MIGVFVTATQIDAPNLRQGVIVFVHDNGGEIEILDESGERYICGADYTIIPDRNIYAITMKWLKEVRSTLYA